MSRLSFVTFCFLTLGIFSQGSDGNVCESFGSNAVYAGSGTCFLLNSTKVTAAEAQDFCQGLGGHLAEIRTEYQRQTFFTIQGPNSRAWLGASDRAVEGEWRWLESGDLMNVSKSWWSDYEPDNNQGAACVVMISPYQRLFDRECSDKYAAMCQKYVGNPCDSVLRGAEYYNGTCYKPVHEKRTIDKAQEYCEGMGSYVAEPSTENHLDFFTMFADMSFDTHDLVMIGLTKASSQLDFKWISTGQAVSLNDYLGSVSTFGTLGNTGTSQRELIVRSENDFGMRWVRRVDTIKAKFICEKVIPVYSHTYLAAIPSSAHSVTDSALLSGSHAYSEAGWITAEIILYPRGQAEERNLLGQNRLEYRATLDLERRNIVVRSTQPLVLTLTLWRHNLSAISSSLLLPDVTSGVSESYLAYPTAGDLSLGISSIGGSTIDLDIAISGGEAGATFNVEESHYRSWPWMTFRASVTRQSQPFYMDSITGYSKAPFIHSGQSVAAFITERQALSNSIADVTFEHVLPTSQLGTEYVTVPSFASSPNVMDTFTIVAAFDNTTVTVPHSDASIASYVVTLVKAGDSLDLELVASGFRHVTGSVPFYLYARLGGSGGSNRCTVTLLSEHLWTERYSVHMVEPWTLLQNVHVVAIGKGLSTSTVFLVNMDGSATMSPVECVEVTGTNYRACYFKLSQAADTYTLSRFWDLKFAAYMIGTHDDVAACHQLGVDLTGAASIGFSHLNFDAQAYLNSVQMETLDLCPQQSTVAPSTSELTTEEETTMLSTLDTTMEEAIASSTLETTSSETTATTISSVSASTASTETSSSFNSPDSQTSPPPSPAPLSTTSNSNSPYSQTTVAPSQIPELATDSVTQSEPLPPCVFKGHNLTQSSEEFREMLASISEFLRVDSVNTSQARRKKESAQDHRVSSVSLGVFGCSLIFTALGMLVLSDCATFFFAAIEIIKG